RPGHIVPRLRGEIVRRWISFSAEPQLPGVNAALYARGEPDRATEGRGGRLGLRGGDLTGDRGLLARSAGRDEDVAVAEGQPRAGDDVAEVVAVELVEPGDAAGGAAGADAQDRGVHLDHPDAERADRH